MDAISIFGRWRSDVFRIYVEEHGQAMRGVHCAMFKGTRVDVRGEEAAGAAVRMRERVPQRGRQVVV